MSDKQQILQQIRAAGVPRTAVPEHLPSALAARSDTGVLAQTFADNLAAAGGECRACPQDGVADALQSIIAGRPSFCAWPHIPEHDDAAHHWQHLACMVVGGQLAVAENGAIWVDTASLQAPAVLSLCQELIVVVSQTDLVPTMAEAYARIELAHPYGVFISGPSKTADVEQCLVIGAHGARALHCLLM